MESAGVGGLVAEVERKERGICNLAGLWIEAGVLQGFRAVGEPVRLGHSVDQDGFGFGARMVFANQRGF